MTISDIKEIIKNRRIFRRYKVKFFTFFAYFCQIKSHQEERNHGESRYLCPLFK